MEADVNSMYFKRKVKVCNSIFSFRLIRIEKAVNFELEMRLFCVKFELGGIVVSFVVYKNFKLF